MTGDTVKFEGPNWTVITVTLYLAAAVISGISSILFEPALIVTSMCFGVAALFTAMDMQP